MLLRKLKSIKDRLFTVQTVNIDQVEPKIDTSYCPHPDFLMNLIEKSPKGRNKSFLSFFGFAIMIDGCMEWDDVEIFSGERQSIYYSSYRHADNTKWEWQYRWRTKDLKMREYILKEIYKEVLNVSRIGRYK